jgi:hypothetical protein
VPLELLQAGREPLDSAYPRAKSLPVVPEQQPVRLKEMLFPIWKCPGLAPCVTGDSGEKRIARRSVE